MDMDKAIFDLPTASSQSNYHHCPPAPQNNSNFSLFLGVGMTERAAGVVSVVLALEDA